MASFKQKLEEKQQSYAYYEGATACMEGLAMNTSPYERGSQPDSEWVDGYLDAAFLRKL